LNPNPATTLPHPASKPRFGQTLLVGGAIALAVGGATAGWMLHGAEQPTVTAAAPAYEALKDEPAAPAEPAKVAKPAPAPRTASTATAKARTPSASGTTLETKRVAATCTDCGIVEAVRPVTRKGEGSGVGAVAGGVVGAVVGNQVGGGNGRKAMTVLGAIGGGLAGHEIEKRAKSETVYEVKVRMEDGSLRTITQATEPAAGSRVIVDGQSLRPASTTEQAPRMLRTSTGA
jgi:outer membrane lipoprotein SlyB